MQRNHEVELTVYDCCANKDIKLCRNQPIRTMYAVQTLLAVKEYNGTDPCKIMQKEESVCCSESEKELLHLHHWH